MNELQGHLKKKPHTSAAWAQWKDAPTDANYAAVFDEVKPIIDSAMTSFAGGDKSLRTRANILTAEAIRSWDPKAGAALRSHVYSRLQRLQRVRAERGAAVRIPENVETDKRAVARFTSEYRDRQGVDPDLDEITDGTSISKRRIMRTRTREYPEGTQSTDKGDLPATKGKADVWRDYVYHDLDARGKKVFELTTGYNGSEIVSKTEIARRLNVTPAAVSLRVNQIIRQLERATT
jgi:DNA-directed RNA polymerase specialized sigma subunit